MDTRAGVTPETDRAYGLALAAFTVFTLIYFAPVLFGREVLLPFDSLYYLDPVFAAVAPEGLPRQPANLMMGWDRVYEFHPWLVFGLRALAGGEFPLWNPFSAGGTPYLALDQTSVLDPLALVSGLLAGAERAGSLRAVLSVWIAGAGMLALGRRLGLPAVAGLLAAMAFAFGGWFIVWLGRPMSVAAAWLPWVFWGIHRLLRSGRPARDAAIVAAFIACSLFAGHIETTAHVLLFSAVFVGFDAWRCRSGGASRVRGAGLGVGALALGVVLAAVLILPFSAFLLGEAGGPGMRGGEELAPAARLLAGVQGHADPGRVAATLRTAFVPVLDPPNALRFSAPPPNLAENTLYIGVVPLLLAAIGLAGREERREKLFWAVAACAALALAWRLPLFDLVNQLPGVRWANPSRLRLIYAFATSIVAGFGLTALMRARVKPARWLLAGGIGLLGLGLIWTLDPLGGAGPAAWRRALIGWVAGIGMLAVLFFPTARRRGTALAGLAALELAIALHGVQPSFPAEEVYPATPAIEYLRARSAGRVATYPIDGRKPLAGAGHLVYGLDSVEGYNVLYLSRWRKLMGWINQGAPVPNRLGPDWLILEDPGDPLVDLLGVRYLVAAVADSGALAAAGIPRQFPRLAWRGSGVAILENPDPLPRAFFVERVWTAARPESALERLGGASFDFRRAAVVEGVEDAAMSGTAFAGGGSVEIRREGLGELVLKLSRATPGFLVVTSAFSEGWRAELDGEPLRLFPADVAFIGAQIPAGSHELRLRYAPLSFRLGRAISVLTALALAAAALLERRRALGRAGSTATASRRPGQAWAPR